MSDNGEERNDILVLVDEDGNEHSFAVIDSFQVDWQDYAILVPVTQQDAETEDFDLDLESDAFIFRIEAEGDEETLVEVSDEEEWNKIAGEWENRLQKIEIDEEEDSE